MPKIPDHIVSKMDARPEYATEEAAARNVLKGLWINKQERDKLRWKLQDKQRGDYQITEFDCLIAALTSSGAQIADLRFHRDCITCATVQKGETVFDVVQTHVGELSREFVHVVFCRYAKERDVVVACLVPETELQFMEPPFRVEISNWNSMRWVISPSDEFCISLHERGAARNWLLDFVCGK